MPPYLFSRKPLLFILFVSVFLFLFHIASYPTVTESIQPVAYYNGYDEQVCLPKEHLKHHPPKQKAKAALVILVRNKELEAMTKTMVNFEQRFNKHFQYPYVFLNESPFTDEFKQAIRAISADVEFGLVPSAHWSYPGWINETYARECRDWMRDHQVFYGDLESYHHMCRYQSGFFFDHPLLDKFEWYWRIEPGVQYFCDITYDPFLYMQKHKKQYGFVVTLLELKDTIPSLWKTVEAYAASRRIDTSDRSGSLFPYFRDEWTGDYNLCHFWSNFEIASLNLWRSPQYRDFFQYLDKTGNFFYERWGDAPVHSLAAGLFLTTDQVHYFEDIGYQHDLYRHCPTEKSGLRCNCDCPVGTNETTIDHDVHYDTCLPQWRKHVKEVEKKKNRWRWT